MQLDGKNRPFLKGLATSLVTDKQIELLFLIDTGATTGQLPIDMINILGATIYRFALVEGSLGETSIRDYYDGMQISLPGINYSGEEIWLDCDTPVGEAAEGKGCVVGADQLVAMRAQLTINYETKNFIIRG